jgi:peptide/nickel transport system substrate-binding protein
MTQEALQRLREDIRAGRISRRSFVQKASAMGIPAAAAMLARSAGAQDDTPVTGGTTSITRDAYLAALEAAYPFEAPQTSGGQVIMASTVDIATLNPIIRSDVIALYAINFIYSYLAVQSPIDGTMAPDLADSWELAGDGVTYTFHINRDATWHDGAPVTAHDCVFSFDAVFSEDTLSPIRADVVQVTKSYRAVDDKTFELVGNNPIALMLEKSVAAVGIMPKHIWESIPFAEWASAPGSTGTDPSQVVGSGPFRFVEWVLGDHVTIARNEDYWVPSYVPTIDTFSIRVVAEAESMIQTLVVGESDTARGVSPVQLQTLEQSGTEFQVATYDDMSWTHVLMNADPELGTFFADKSVRQAMMYAVDRELMVETMLNGYGTPAVGVQPPSSPAYAPDKVTTVYTYDPGKAMTLLEMAGWVDADGDGIRERDGERFSMDFPFSDSDPVNAQLVPYLQQAFREIGIEILPQSIPAPTLSQSLGAGDFQMSLSKIFWTLDDMGILYRCDAIPPNGFNRARHCNPEYDRLNTASLFELDPEKRRQLMIRQGNVSNDDAHYGLLYFGQSVFPVNPRLKNVFVSAYASGIWSQARIWIADE